MCLIARCFFSTDFLMTDTSSARRRAIDDDFDKRREELSRRFGDELTEILEQPFREADQFLDAAEVTCCRNGRTTRQIPCLNSNYPGCPFYEPSSGQHEDAMERERIDRELREQHEFDLTHVFYDPVEERRRRWRLAWHHRLPSRDRGR
jgi:hypothetical protein